MFKILSFNIVLILLFSCGCTSIDLTTPTPPVEDLTEEDNQPSITTLTYISSNVNSLRVRSAPNGNSKTIGHLDKGDLVMHVDEVGDYYKTVFMEQTAYVHSNYCKKIEIDSSHEEVENAISIGSTLLGYPYVWGSQRYHWGNGKLNTNYVHGEYDCSALVQYVYYVSNGVKLDLTTRTQVNNGVSVSKEELKRGDLMFFTNSSRKNLSGVERIGHVGIYFGNNYILHTASDHAVIEPISDTRWSYYITARRVV